VEEETEDKFNLLSSLDFPFLLDFAMEEDDWPAASAASS
jgi:hypothetical protein